MIFISRIKWISVWVFSIVFLAGCATESELQEQSLNRYVKDGVYSNSLKRFSMTWPSKSIWKNELYPEFDLSFNHLDGNAQIFVISVHGLVRKTFPDGFTDWIMQRLQARNVKIISRKNISQEPDERWYFEMDANFQILSNENFGVDRRISITVFRKKSRWIAGIYLAPVKSFDVYKDAAGQIINSIKIIRE